MNVKIIIISVLAACCLLFISLWLGSIGDQEKLRATISSLEKSNKRIKAESNRIHEVNRELESTIKGLKESERERQEKYNEIRGTIKELYTNQGKFEQGIDGILKKIGVLEKTIQKLLDLVFN